MSLKHETRTGHPKKCTLFYDNTMKYMLDINVMVLAMKRTLRFSTF